MKAVIVYASMTGTTELMANSISKTLADAGITVVERDILDAAAEELKAYDLVLIGSYTWGDGELPDEFYGFYAELLETDLSGKKAAVFGAGDSSYDHFARAVDILEETLKDQGCAVLLPGLKADRETDDRLQELSIDFGRKVNERLNEILQLNNKGGVEHG